MQESKAESASFRQELSRERRAVLALNQQLLTTQQAEEVNTKVLVSC